MPKLKLNPSSQVHSAMYDPQSETLTLELNDKGVHHYFNVPVHKATGLANAESPGQYFHQHIRNHPDHEHKRVK